MKKGDFVNNTFEGIGKYCWPDKSFYEGEWKNGRYIFLR